MKTNFLTSFTIGSTNVLLLGSEINMVVIVEPTLSLTKKKKKMRLIDYEM